jgi:hypothetical protein
MAARHIATQQVISRQAESRTGRKFHPDGIILASIERCKSSIPDIFIFYIFQS